MEAYCQARPLEAETKNVKVTTWMQVVVGSMLLALCAQISIPIQPVPMTLQTLALYLLATSLGGKKAAMAALLYLAEATVGLPVLAGGNINPLWMFGSSVGYLLSFPAAAYVIGSISQRHTPSSIRTALAIMSGQVIIYGLGALFLAQFIGTQLALTLGVLPFLAWDALKVLLCSCITKYSGKLGKSLG